MVRAPLSHTCGRPSERADAILAKARPVRPRPARVSWSSSAASPSQDQECPGDRRRLLRSCQPPADYGNLSAVQKQVDGAREEHGQRQAEKESLVALHFNAENR